MELLHSLEKIGLVELGGHWWSPLEEMIAVADMIRVQQTAINPHKAVSEETPKGDQP
jgi:hypothetical protein